MGNEPHESDIEGTSRDDAHRVIPLGVDKEANEIRWDTTNDIPYLAVVAPVGAGRTAMRILVEEHTAKYPEQWELYGVDLSTSILSRTIGDYKKIAHDLNSAQKLVESIRDMMTQRYKAMEEHQVTKYTDLPDKPKSIMLVIDEFSSLAKPREQQGESRFEYLQNETDRQHIYKQIEEIALFARPTGIHFILLNPREDFSRTLNRNTGLVSFEKSSRGGGHIHTFNINPGVDFYPYYPSNN